MANDKTARTFTDVLASLHEFADEDITSLPSDQVRNELKAEGIDVDPLIRSLKATLNQAKGREALARAHQEREQKLKIQERRNQTVRTQPSCPRPELIARINARQAQRAAAGVYFRKLNLDELTDEALQQILDDYELLDEIDGKGPDGAPES